MNPFIDHVFVFTTEETGYLYHANEDFEESITLIPIDRPTYKDYFNEAAKYPDDINIICNSDIYFDESIQLVQKIQANEAYVLTRHEYNDGDIQTFFRIHGCPPDWSQDCVIWRGVNKVKNVGTVWATNLKTNADEMIPYTLGHPGQENHMAWLLKNAGYTVKNPCNSIRAIHVHKERSRPDYKYRIKGQNGGGTWGRLAKVEPCSI